MCACDLRQLYCHLFETSLGWVGLAASDRGIVMSTLPVDTREECERLLGPRLSGTSDDPRMFQELEVRLLSYFEGEDQRFDDVELDVEYTSEFHRRALQACRRIPYSETRTYRWLAEQAGEPIAFRAAGQVMARNPAPVIVPCHRVVGSDGSLRGFGSGDTRLDLKRDLLELESRGRRLL